jgi:hypothetical protein
MDPVQRTGLLSRTQAAGATRDQLGTCFYEKEKKYAGQKSVGNRSFELLLVAEAVPNILAGPRELDPKLNRPFLQLLRRVIHCVLGAGNLWFDGVFRQPQDPVREPFFLVLEQVG